MVRMFLLRVHAQGCFLPLSSSQSCSKPSDGGCSPFGLACSLPPSCRERKGSLTGNDHGGPQRAPLTWAGTLRLGGGNAGLGQAWLNQGRTWVSIQPTLSCRGWRGDGGCTATQREPWVAGLWLAVCGEEVLSSVTGVRRCISVELHSWPTFQFPFRIPRSTAVCP